MPGRSTFTATRRGGSSVVWASCTCAMEAAATGSPKRENSCSTGLPSATSICVLRDLGRERRQTVLQSLQRGATSPPTISGRVASIWPSLI